MKFRKPNLSLFCLIVLVVLASCLSAYSNPRVRTFIQNGQSIDEIIVDGRPPANFRAPIAVVPSTDIAAGLVTLQDVPAFDWCYGCSATSAAMVMGYYDNNGYPNMYSGPANGGVCPMSNAVWGSGESPLSATHQGYDGRNLLGHVDDYWRAYGNCDPDPYVGAWTEHAQGDCTGDFMGTNQSKVSNCDGATTFYFGPGGSALSDYTGSEPSQRDGCHGMKLFVQSRGYNVTANFSQYIYGYNGNTTGFTFADFQSEIDQGRPVLIQVDDHTMVGYGYDSTSQTIYIHDTWDHNSHSMVWGGSYSGLTQYGVTVMRLGCAGTNPTIASQPVSCSSCIGQSVSFSITATGGPLTYQWRKKRAVIIGATLSTYTIGSVTSGDAGSYSCAVSNACGSTMSSTATLTVNTPLSMTTQPISQIKCLGQSVTFTAAASGTAPLSYQWRRNTTIITGATNPTITINPVGTSDAGNYDCVVTNPCGSAVSNAATLTVNTGPSITNQPSNTLAWVGGPATLSVTASGMGSLVYQWRKGGSSITGAQGSSYTIAVAALSDNASYDCLVTSDCGSTASAAATLTVVTPTAAIADVKLTADGLPVALVGKPITYTSANFFYVEETDRSSGIRVERAGHWLTAGSCADLVGVLSTNADSERFIAATSAIGHGVGNASVIAMGNAAVGGMDWRYNSVTHAGQKGGTSVVGLNNIGLLIETWGKFTKTSDTVFVLDDGSYFPITCVVEPPLALSPLWQYAAAVGVSSISRVSDTVWSPRVLVREIHAY